ncbi:MAG: acylphosphatase [Pseudomonadales bacterium]
MAEINCVHGYASGQVQGVWYRDFVRRCALRYNASGWAKNLADGRVEFRLFGSQADLLQLIADLRTGPELSLVDDVVYQWHHAKAENGFRIL